jgi:hypothetical protein
MVWEFENDFVIALHLMENKLKEQHNDVIRTYDLSAQS